MTTRPAGPGALRPSWKLRSNGIHDPVRMIDRRIWRNNGSNDGMRLAPVPNSGYRRRGSKWGGVSRPAADQAAPHRARDHRSKREWHYNQNRKPFSGMRQSRTHRQSDSRGMKDATQGQHDHRGERRRQYANDHRELCDISILSLRNVTARQ